MHVYLENCLFAKSDDSKLSNHRGVGGGKYSWENLDSTFYLLIEIRHITAPNTRGVFVSN